MIGSLDKNHFFYFHPSEHDCFGLKGACQRRADTGRPVCLMTLFNKICLICCPDVVKALSTRNNPVSIDENRNNAAAFRSINVELII